MAYLFLDLASTPSVKAAQVANGAGEFWANFVGHRDSDRLTDAEARFIQARDSFYLATVSESGWPYVQHRGGPAGFLRVMDEQTLAFLDFRGNRQYISLGNLASDGRAALILMDYPNRRRLKIYGRVEAKDLDGSRNRRKPLTAGI
jgi:predicted pyridoxine 5'-phosphate oxidase superfamily flavin-nucleotide-binding protein